jgi:hypothetical protein
MAMCTSGVFGTFTIISQIGYIWAYTEGDGVGLEDLEAARPKRIGDFFAVFFPFFPLAPRTFASMYTCPWTIPSFTSIASGKTTKVAIVKFLHLVHLKLVKVEMPFVLTAPPDIWYIFQLHTLLF